jgi:hypothetical protein
MRHPPVNNPVPVLKWINEKAKLLFDLLEDILDNTSGESVIPFYINPSSCGSTSPIPNGLPNGGCG